MSPSAAYWEARARRFAVEGAGLAAVCSYGMPAFYNRAIDACQRRALRPWLRVPPGARVLDVGCGVGRWSLELATQGARVTGIDLSPTMIAQATLRAHLQGVAARCRFRVQDLARLDAGGPFDLVLGVTVLQHILDPAALHAAVERLAAHLAPGGTLVLLEAAPQRRIASCDSAIFRARPRSAYLRLFAACGLRLRAMRGVDPAPFKTWLVPHLARLPPQMRTPTLALVTAVSLPIDLLLGPRALRRSWHAVFVLEHAREAP
ncbi:MAG TPA: class I SAM-dependent methyltransferase [Steroidobacteraceae bacterium]|nr:class I SAM-dependent methyltransferase [Steroidobacteraceae bacterium]